MIALERQCAEETHPWRLRGFQMMRLPCMGPEQEDDRQGESARGEGWRTLRLVGTTS